jgi:Outer membrane protein beta-barrel domain
MPTPRWMPLLRHVSLLATAVTLATAAASAQSTPAHDPSSAPSFNESSSSAALPAADEAEGAALPAASGASTGAAAGQERGRYYSRSLFSHLTYEAGGGANGPTSDSSPYITWGGNFTGGVGYRFNPYISLMAEYQFMDDKLPGTIIAETGSDGGHAHIWSLTLDPVIDLFPKATNSVYVTGGGGFYRKVTSFTDIEPTEYCDYFYCGIGYSPQVVGHFSSNQGGWSIGGGFTHRLGGINGDGKAKLFAEARYLDVMTPAVTTSANGLPVTSVGAETKVIPITLGVRF